MSELNESTPDAASGKSADSCVNGMTREEFIRKVVKKAAVAGTLVAAAGAYKHFHPGANVAGAASTSATV